jgi:hypothetical protein
MARIDERQTQMADVEALHQTEKEARLKTEQDHAEAKKAEVSEWRKFRWGVLATFVTILVDLISRFFVHLLPK